MVFLLLGNPILPVAFQERTKALGYMNSGAYKALEDAGHVPDKPPSDVNELDVHVIRCNGVQPRRPGKYSAISNLSHLSRN